MLDGSKVARAGLWGRRIVRGRRRATKDDLDRGVAAVVSGAPASHDGRVRQRVLVHPLNHVGETPRAHSGGVQGRLNVGRLDRPLGVEGGRQQPGREPIGLHDHARSFVDGGRRGVLVLEGVRGEGEGPSGGGRLLLQPIVVGWIGPKRVSDRPDSCRIYLGAPVHRRHDDYPQRPSL